MWRVGGSKSWTRARQPGEVVMGADRGVPGHLVLASVQSPAVTTSLRPCRWRGEAPEPRAGLASGHIPGSKTLQFANVLQDGRCVPAGRQVCA